MTRDEKITTILNQLEDNDKLRLLVRFIIKNAITNNVDDTVLDAVYLLLNPIEE